MAREALKTREGLPDIHQLANQGFFVYSIPVVSRDESTGQTRNFGTVTIAVRQECSSYEELGRYLQENSGNRGNARVLNYNANWEYASAGVRDIGAAVENAVEEEGTHRLVVGPTSSIMRDVEYRAMERVVGEHVAGSREKPPFVQAQAEVAEERREAGIGLNAEQQAAITEFRNAVSSAMNEGNTQLAYERGLSRHRYAPSAPLAAAMHTEFERLTGISMEVARTRLPPGTRI